MKALTSSPIPRTAPQDTIAEGWSELRQAVREGLETIAERVGGTVRDEGDEGPVVFRLCVDDVSFPDHVGAGRIVAYGAEAYGCRRLSIELQHDRTFPSGRPLYLNDYLWIREFERDAPPSEATVREALQGLERARRALEAVQARADEGGSVYLSRSLRAEAGGEGLD